MDHYKQVATALEYIREHFTDQPDLDEIAAHVNLSPYHFHRVFKEWAGVTPKKFLQYISLEHAKRLLKDNNTLEETTFETGLSSAGRLHDLFVNVEGMTPGEFKKNGAGLTLFYETYTSPFGQIAVTSTEKGICQLTFPIRKERVASELKANWPNARLVHSPHRHHEPVAKFFGINWDDLHTVKLHLKGTPFQLRVWKALLKIPAGGVVSYSDIAQEIGNPKAQRAVGSAIGQNPVAYLIPCHRVIRKMGEFGGYRWGAVRKRAMLGWEWSVISESDSS